MAIATYADYLTMIRQAQRVDFAQEGPTVGTQMFASSWIGGPEGGSVPTGPVVCSNLTTGAIQTGGSATSRLVGIDACSAPYQGPANMQSNNGVLLIDRLSHQGGLVANSTGLQTGNFPTAALTRYTDGVGVMAAAQIYTGVGGTAAMGAVSYTNQNGTTGRTGYFRIGGTGFINAGTWVPMSLQAGDTGVRAIASVQLNLSTGIAGAFGMVLYKPLALWRAGRRRGNTSQCAAAISYDAFLNWGHLPQIQQGACLANVMAVAAGPPDVQYTLLIGHE